MKVGTLKERLIAAPGRLNGRLLKKKGKKEGGKKGPLQRMMTWFVCLGRKYIFHYRKHLYIKSILYQKKIYKIKLGTK